MALKTNYKDDILDTSENTNRVFDLVDGNGNVIQANVSLIEKTVLSQQGDNFGANDINSTNEEVNQINDNLTASDDLIFNFAKDPNSTDHGFLDAQGNFIPFKTTHTETINVNTNGTVDMGVDHKNRYVNVNVPVTADLLYTRSGGYGSTHQGTNAIDTSKYKALIIAFAGYPTGFPSNWIYIPLGGSAEIGKIQGNNYFGRTFTFNANGLTHGPCGNEVNYGGDIYEAAVYGLKNAPL